MLLRSRTSSYRIPSIILYALIALSLIGAVSCSGSGSSKGGSEYRFATVTRGTMEKTVSSSGNLEPVSTVSVLSEMSGRVETVNADYNDRVTQGQVLVRLNTDMLKLQETSERAAVKKIEANYGLQLLDYENKSKLAEKGLVSDYELKSAKTSLDVVSADLDSARASLAVIETKIKDYAFIRSPISGIVLARNVDVGQSVVEGSSSNSSSIFTIAEDLENMEIKAKVDELDISSIRKDMKARFTVEALPEESFTGKVKEIRLVPETTNNVVNYYVMVAADNRSGKLLPGMTAEVTFIESLDEGVLLVPNAALRYSPSSLSADESRKMIFVYGLRGMSDSEKAKAIEDFEKAQKAAAGSQSARGAGGLTGVMMGPRPGFRAGSRRSGAGGPSGSGGSAAGRRASSTSSGTASMREADREAGFDPSSMRTLWYLNEKGSPAVRLVVAGASDGTNTIISDPYGEEGLEGLKVILQEAAK